MAVRACTFRAGMERFRAFVRAAYFIADFEACYEGWPE